MAWNTALESATYTALRANSYAAEQFLCLWPNPIVFKAQLTSTPTGNSYASVIFGSAISGDSGDVEIGMRVIIGPNDDVQDAIRRARQNDQGFDGRVRAAVSGSTLPINETSADLADTYYLFVIEDYPVLDRLARGNPQLKDWDDTFEQLPPIIGNLPTAYGGVVDSSDVLEIDLAPTAIAGTDGASITGWQWTVPTGITITTGTDTDQNITIEADPGNYIVTLVVTDGTRSWTRRVYVFAVPSNFSSVVSLGVDGAEITGDVEDGCSATVAAFAGIDAVYDNTLCLIFDRVYVSGAAASIVTETRLVGRLRTETDTMRPDESSGPLLETRFEIEGAAAQLGRVKGPSLTLKDDTSPTIWDEIDKATYWRVIAHVLQRHSTFLETHSLAFSDTTDNYRLSRWGTNGADMLAECNQLADSIGASMEFAPDGRAQINRRGTQLSTAGRDALVTVAALTNQDMIEISSIERNHVQVVGLVKANGGTFNTNNNKVASYTSHAPGTARGPGPDDKPLVGQVLLINSAKAVAEAELNARTGNFFAEENPQDIMTVIMPDGWRFLNPSRAQWYTWTLTATDTNLRGISYTTAIRWWLRSVTVRQDNALPAGTVEAVFVRETRGSEGETIPPPPQGSISNPIPAIPPIIGIPDIGFDPGILYPGDPPPFYNEPIYPVPNPGMIDGIPADGNAVVYHNDIGVWYTLDYLSVGHTPVEITPTLRDGHTVRDVKIGFGKEVYVLTSDGSVSYIYYFADGFAPAAAYVESAEIGGVFSSIRPTSTQGEVWLYGAEAGGQAEDVNEDYWLSKPYSFSFIDDNLPTEEGGQFTEPIDAYPGGVGVLVDVDVTASAAHAVKIGDPSFSAIWANGGNIAAGNHQRIACLTTDETEFETLFSPFTRLFDHNQTHIRTASPPLIRFVFDGQQTGSAIGNVRIIVEKATQAFPGGSGDTAQVTFSDDFGATWATPETLGDTPGAFGGVDALPIGDLLLAGYDGQVAETDSTLTVSDYGDPMPTGGQPNAILIPRYQFGSSVTSNTTATPQYLVASDTLTAGDEALWKVTSTGTVFTDITPHDGTDYGLATGPRCLAMHWKSGSLIAAVLLFGATPKLCISEDAGSTWAFDILDDDAQAVIFRKGDATLTKLYITDGNPAYSPDLGVSIVTKAFPGDASTNPIQFIDPYG
jgi:hypothetical protein